MRCVSGKSFLRMEQGNKDKTLLEKEISE